MKILIASDLHMEKRRLLPIEGVSDFDVLVCAGDIFDGDVRKSWELLLGIVGDRDCVFVAGNHEFWGHAAEHVIEAGRAISQEFPNFHFLENESVEIGGVTFAGATLWEAMPIARDGDQPDLSKILTGEQPHPAPHPAVRYGQGIDMRGPDFDRPAKWRDIQRVHETSVEYLRGCQADVIVTHFPPSPAVFAKVKASLWICGHEHGHADLSIGNRRLVRNALGYPGQETWGFIDNFIVELPTPNLRC